MVADSNLKCVNGVFWLAFEENRVGMVCFTYRKVYNTYFTDSPSLLKLPMMLICNIAHGPSLGSWLNISYNLDLSFDAHKADRVNQHHLSVNHVEIPTVLSILLQCT